MTKEARSTGHDLRSQFYAQLNSIQTGTAFHLNRLEAKSDILHYSYYKQICGRDKDCPKKALTYYDI